METNINTAATVVIKCMMPPAEALKRMDEVCHTQLMLTDERGVKFAEDPWHVSDVFVAIMAKDITNYGGSHKDAKLAVRMLFNRVAGWELDWLAELNAEGKDVYPHVYQADNGAWCEYMDRVDAPSLDTINYVMWEAWYKVSKILCSSIEDQRDFAIDTGNAIIPYCVSKYAVLEREVWYRHCRERRKKKTDIK